MFIQRCKKMNNDDYSCLDCLGVPYGDAVEDCAGICGGDTVEDCAGTCGGSAMNDECGVCNGDGSTCAAYIESSVITTVDEAEVDDPAFADNFESLLETALGLPDSTVEVININILPGRSQSVNIEVEFIILLTEEELAETSIVDVEAGYREFLRLAKQDHMPLLSLLKSEPLELQSSHLSFQEYYAARASALNRLHPNPFEAK